MKNNQQPETCYACGGSMNQGQTTFTADFGTGLVVVRNVPATVCSQCGMEWINDNTAAQIETIVKEAKNKHSMVEILSLSA